MNIELRVVNYVRTNFLGMRVCTRHAIQIRYAHGTHLQSDYSWVDVPIVELPETPKGSSK
jgi:hypothetical protein